MQIISLHAIAQNPYIYYMQKSPDLYDRMCFKALSSLSLSPDVSTK